MVLGTISDNLIQNHYFTSLFGQTPPRNSIAMATSKVPGDQKPFERVCYTLIREVTKFFGFLHQDIIRNKIA